MLKRIGWFLLVNILVLVTISISMSVLGVRPYLTGHGIDFGSLLAYSAIVGFSGAFISLALSRILAKSMMGVQLVDQNAPGDAGWVARKVQELARSAQLPAMPEVGVFESPEPNAFATGPTRSRSLVAVSTGLLRTMNKDEIEGVLAHEVAHIKNGDMVTMVLLQGVINTFAIALSRIVAFFVSQALQGRSDRDGESAASGWVFPILVLVFDIAFTLLGSLVVNYFSQQREFRADAGSASLVGRQKMVAALRKLQQVHGEVPAGSPASLAPLRISGKEGGMFSAFQATHPPLALRIARLEGV